MNICETFHTSIT